MRPNKSIWVARACIDLSFCYLQIWWNIVISANKSPLTRKTNVSTIQIHKTITLSYLETFLLLMMMMMFQYNCFATKKKIKHRNTLIAPCWWKKNISSQSFSVLGFYSKLNYIQDIHLFSLQIKYFTKWLDDFIESSI